MRYQVVKLGAGDLARIESFPYSVVHPDSGITLYEGVRVRGFAPEMELASHATIPLKTLGDVAETTAIVQKTLQGLQAELVGQIRYYVSNLIEASPDDYDTVTIYVRTQPTCLCADEPIRPIYDKPSEWDEDVDDWVYPEDAVVIGLTESKLGWVLYTVIGLSLTRELPSDFPVNEELPLRVQPASTFPAEHLMTALGRLGAEAATAFGQSVSFLVS